METEDIKVHDKILAFIDIGTNSIRMIIIGLKKNRSYTVIREEREVVRLGESVFKKGYFQPKAMKKAITVCRTFVEVANAFSADEIIAYATCATRESKNQSEFIEALHTQASLNVRVVSGTEEARLVYLGVSNGTHIENTTTMFIDIGGGSTEIALGNQYQYQNLETLGIGSLRLTSMFLKDGGKAPVSLEIQQQIKGYVKNKTLRAIERLQQQPIELCIGSSGTIINLAEIARKEYKKNNSKRDLLLKYKDLKKIITKLAALDIDKRRKIPGINPERADIIIPGAIILETLMEEFSIKEVAVSKFGLRHGMVTDYLQRHGQLLEPEKMSVRTRSIVRLAHTFSINEAHALTVQSLVQKLFDSSKTCLLHNYGDTERELLSYAAYLHDIGNFISFRNHHHHSYYVISNAELPGFDQMEVTIISLLARFHRKKLASKKQSELRKLDKQSQRMIITLSILLRIAEKLDRSHLAIIKNAEFTRVSGGKATVSIYADRDCELEIWGIESIKDQFEKVFEKQLVVQVHRLSDTDKVSN